MIRSLTDNLGTLTLALVLAIFVWFVAIQETNPIDEQPYREPVRVVMLNMPVGTVPTDAAGAVLSDPPNESIEVVVRGPRQVLAELQPSDFEAIVDLSTVPLGGADVPVVVTVDNPLVSIVQQDVESVRIHLEQFRSRSLPITLSIVGEPALGHIAGEPVMETQTVTLEGPASRVDPVQEAQARLSIEGAREAVEEAVAVRLTDARGRLVTGLEAYPTQILVSVPVSKSDEYAELFVTVNITGTTAPGYRLVDYSVEPQRVTIFGPPKAVSALPGFVSTFVVDVSGADTDLVQRVGLQVPEKVTLIGDQTVLVILDVEPILTSLTVPWRPTVQGPDSGLAATISPETINVSLVGPLALMESFDPETDLSLTLNLYGMEPGSYQLLPAAFSNVAGVEIEGVLPSALLVEIYPLAMATPAPVVTGTATLTSTLTPGLPSTPAPTPVQ